MDLADESFRSSIGFDQNNSRVRNNYAAFLFSQDRFREAYEQLLVVSADTGYEGRSLAFESLGRIAVRIDLEDEAEQAFERALQLNPDLYLAALELAQIKFNKQQLAAARLAYNQFLTIREFNSIPHSPGSLWIGIQIESEFPNSETLEVYVRLLTTLYRDAPEHQLYRNFINGI
jgi:type IV pilus assembly protein PilF